MKALEFKSQLNTEGKLEVPEDLAARIPKDQPLQVVILFSESTEDEAWQHLTHRQFLEGYGEGDSAYDSL